MNLTQNQIQIIAIIKADPNVTAGQLQEHLDLSEKEFYSEIRGLRTSGVLSHVGLANAGTWILKGINRSKDGKITQ